MTTPRHLLPLALAALLAAAVAPANAAPKIDAFTVDTAASQSTIRFTAESGSTYELQRASVLAPAADWATIDTRRAAADGPMELTDGVPAGRTRSYYRIAEAASSASTYLVVDMTGGPNAAKWPVTELDGIPDGGWTDEYKTGKLVLRRIPAGTFTMGSPTGELGRYDREVQHQVTISRPFYMGVFEVTQRQWELAMGTRPSYFTNNACYRTRPVESVSYADIRGSKGGAEWPKSGAVDSGSFLYVLRMKTGLAFDLPTEAQWEYACRAGTTNALNSGKDLTHPYTCTNVAAVARYSANGGKNADSSSGADTGTAPVGSYIPNHWDLYDMHGNVWEWCLDWWWSKLPADPVTDPPGTSSNTTARVRRGGTFNSDARECRSASRNYRVPSQGAHTIGFRLACPVPAKYLVVDMAEGRNASSWPVHELDDVPDGGWTYEHKTTKLVLRRIPAGTFVMGSPTNELGRYSDETQHQVTISQAFYMGVFEVTQKQWELAMGSNPAQYTGDARPVEQVSYNDIRGADKGSRWPSSHNVDEGSFLLVLREKTGLTFDLPTEAQWEYACRAGTTTALNSGKNLTEKGWDPEMNEVGRYRDNGGADGQHVPVGSYGPNAWGLFDMHGNVAEWCLDWYGDYDAGAVTDPAGAASGARRVTRGGHWYYWAGACRSATRLQGAPSWDEYTEYGLRLAIIQSE